MNESLWFRQNKDTLTTCIHVLWLLIIEVNILSVCSSPSPLNSSPSWSFARGEPVLLEAQEMGRCNPDSDSCGGQSSLQCWLRTSRPGTEREELRRHGRGNSEKRRSESSKSLQINVGKDGEKRKPFALCCTMETGTAIWKTVWLFFFKKKKKTKMELPHDPVIPLLAYIKQNQKH